MSGSSNCYHSHDKCGGVTEMRIQYRAVFPQPQIQQTQPESSPSDGGGLWLDPGSLIPHNQAGLSLPPNQTTGRPQPPNPQHSSTVPLSVPRRLVGITKGTGNHHHRSAWRTLDGGSLSSRPCHSCTARNLPYIVNSGTSSRCVECILSDNGSHCDATGVQNR